MPNLTRSESVAGIITTDRSNESKYNTERLLQESEENKWRPRGSIIQRNISHANSFEHFRQENEY